MRLRYTLPAQADFNQILDYVAERSPQAAARIQARIKRATELLLSHPFMGVQTADPTIRRTNTSPYPYLIFYEVTEQDIIIHAIRHAARNPSGMPGRS
jgi:plasmid stabilization system protein ParE